MKIYVLLVQKHLRTCDPTNTSVTLVPKAYRAATIAGLAAIGLDPNGDPIVEAPAEETPAEETPAE